MPWYWCLESCSSEPWRNAKLPNFPSRAAEHMNLALAVMLDYYPQ